jgi:hypothetical protein
LTSAYNIRLDRHQQPQLRTMVSEDKKHEWEDNWSKDSGVDGEDYWEKHDSSRRYGYARPSRESCNGALASSKYSDALLASMLNLPLSEIGTLRDLIRVELAQESTCPSRSNVFAKGEPVQEVLRTDNQTRQEARHDTDGTRDATIQYNMYKKFWVPMDREGKRVERNAKQREM